MSTVHFWLRHEVKPGEKRTGLTPQICSELLAEHKGVLQITVERSATRIFPDQEYEAVGCSLTQSETWPSAPNEAIIVGLKELPESKEALIHQHIFFAHCYKNQAGWKELLQRFIEGQGSLLDLEYVLDASGRRVAAFGVQAGMAGVAVGLLQFAQRNTPDAPALQNLQSWSDSAAMIAEVKQALSKASRQPRVAIIGALGRCGRGAVGIAQACGLPEESILQWDMAETKGRGRFQELLAYDVLINTIFLSFKIPPFLELDMFETKERKLAVIVDVSCDVSSPNNPLPFVKVNTTLAEPILRVFEKEGLTPVDISSVDHLPTLLPRESSEHFSSALKASYKQLIPVHDNWDSARDLFVEHVQKILDTAE